MKLPDEVSKDIDLLWLHKNAPGPKVVLSTMEAIVLDCAAVCMTLRDIDGLQTAKVFHDEILKRYGIEP